MTFLKNNINYIIVLSAAITSCFQLFPNRATANSLNRHLKHSRNRSVIAIKKHPPHKFNLLPIKQLVEEQGINNITDKNQSFVSNNNLVRPIKNKIQIARSVNGKASWYGGKFHGRRTASGEIFNQHDLTAAHRYLPFGTRVKVTNVNTGRSVIVRINDRGPFVKGRVIDLSAAAARTIGLIRSGVAPVQISILGR